MTVLCMLTVSGQSIVHTVINPWVTVVVVCVCVCVCVCVFVCVCVSVPEQHATAFISKLNLIYTLIVHKWHWKDFQLMNFAEITH